ncbi:unnamed protein product, partial [Ascophyllum nodosum]
ACVRTAIRVLVLERKSGPEIVFPMTISSGSRSDSSKARWLTLRKAFVSAVAAANGRKDGTTSHSSRQKEKRFDGFKLFPRHEEEEGSLRRSGEGDVLATYRLPDG